MTFIVAASGDGEPASRCLAGQQTVAPGAGPLFLVTAPVHRGGRAGIFAALPLVLRRGLGTVISGTLVAPFLAVVVTLVYYRLVAIVPGTQAHAGYGTGPGPVV